MYPVLAMKCAMDINIIFHLCCFTQVKGYGSVFLYTIGLVDSPNCTLCGVRRRISIPGVNFLEGG